MSSRSIWTAAMILLFILVSFQQFQTRLSSVSTRVEKPAVSRELAQNPNSVGGQVVANVSVGSNPLGVRYDSGNGYVYVANQGSNSVSVINGTNSQIAVVQVKSQPSGVAYDIANGYVYVANQGSGNVSVLSGTTVIASVPVESQPTGMTYDPRNGFVYLSDQDSNDVSVISGVTVIATIQVGPGPYGEAYDAANGYVYVANSGGSFPSDTVSVINGTAVIATITVGDHPYGVAYDPSNGYIYVSDQYSDDVSVINGTSVIAVVPVGNQPVGVAYDSANGFLYVANYFSNTVSVISGITIVESIPVGSYPIGVEFDSGDGSVYVTNYYSNDVSVISSAGFTFSPIPPEEGLAVTFNATASPMAGAIGWDFGDGSTGTGNSISHTYASPGTFKVIETVTDSEGGIASASRLITIYSRMHDIDLLTSAISRPQSYVGIPYVGSVTWNVTVANNGVFSETFWVAAMANTTISLGNQTVTLLPGATSVITFTWSPPISSRASYSLSAMAQVIPGDPVPPGDGISGYQFNVQCKGDITGDRVTNIIDLVQVARAFGRTRGQAQYNANADLNADGVINIVDLVFVASVFGQTC